MLKKFMCFALAVLFLFSAGCADEGVDISTNSSVEEASQNETSQDENPKEEVNQHTEYTAKIENMLSGDTNRSLNKRNLLFGKKYTTSIAAHKDYPDTKGILTDGVMPMNFAREENWAGYVLNAEQVNTIEVDIGKTTDGIMDISVRTLEMEDFAIFTPKSISVYVAGDDKEFVKVGTVYRPDGELSQDCFRDYSLYLQGTVTARYIRFEITANKRGWLFVGETVAFAYSEKFEEFSETGASINEYYGYEGIPYIETEEYWQEGEDFNEIQNLIKGKKAIISAGAYADGTLITDWYNTRNTAMFGDGRKASQANIGDAAWFHITRGESREITFDLGKISSVSGFATNFLYDASAGVRYPGNISVKLSIDGKNWQTVFYHGDLSANEEEEIFCFDEDFEKEYKARYFQLSFTVNTHTYIDEISVDAKKNTENAIDLIPDEASPENGAVSYDGYAMPEDLCGVNNMMLSYHCYTNSQNQSDEQGLITAEEYLPYVAYLDDQGNIKDTFFDAFLYLPYVRHIHGQGSNYGRSADGWRTYVDDMFYEDRNMNALDKCAETVFNQLGITDKKLKVFTSILYTYPTLHSGDINPFGDIDGDGVNEDFSDINDRKKAIKWLMDEELNRFNENNYENLEFCGYYWFEEGIDSTNSQEKELVAFAVDYAHQLGYKIFWIPYQNAAGVKNWADFGFDVACLQPNYMFNNISSNVLYTTAETASGLGMCVEIEINDPENKYEANKYTEYLIAGAQTGYMKAIKMYYQVGVPGAFHTACYSKDSSVRAIYDNTYLFAMEKFKPVWPEEVIISETELEFNYTMDSEFEGSVDVSAFEGIGGSMVVTLSPKYGSVKLNNDGSFVYYPAKGFKGDDKFEIAFDLGYGTPVSTVVNMICQ